MEKERRKKVLSNKRRKNIKYFQKIIAESSLLYHQKLLWQRIDKQSMCGLLQLKTHLLSHPRQMLWHLIEWSQWEHHQRSKLKLRCSKNIHFILVINDYLNSNNVLQNILLIKCEKLNSIVQLIQKHVLRTAILLTSKAHCFGTIWLLTSKKTNRRKKQN